MLEQWLQSQPRKNLQQQRDSNNSEISKTGSDPAVSEMNKDMPSTSTSSSSSPNPSSTQVPPNSTTTTPDTNTKIPTRRWTFTAVLKGLNLFVDGTARVLKSRRTRAPAMKALAFLAIVATILFIINHSITTPLRTLRRFLMWFDWDGKSWSVYWLNMVIGSADWVVKFFLVMTPDAGLYFLRYIYPEPLDKIFFEAMKSMTSELSLPGSRARFSIRFARYLETCPPSRSAHFIRLANFAQRYARRIGLLVVVWLASCLPVVGVMAWPLATIAFIYVKLGLTPTLWIAGVSLISPPLGKFVAGPMLREILGFRSLGRELVEPYLTRSKMTHTQQRQWLHKNEPLLAGFTLPCYFALMIPTIGPVLHFALAQAAAARLCLELFDDVDLFDGGPRGTLEKPGTGSVGGVAMARGESSGAISAGVSAVFGETALVGGGRFAEVAKWLDAQVDWAWKEVIEIWQVLKAGGKQKSSAASEAAANEKDE